MRHQFIQRILEKEEVGNGDEGWEDDEVTFRNAKCLRAIQFNIKYRL